MLLPFNQDVRCSLLPFAPNKFFNGEKNLQSQARQKIKAPATYNNHKY